MRDVATALEMTDLAACRQVKEMVEQGTVTVRPNHAYSEPLDHTDHAGHVGHVPTVELDSFEEFEDDAPEPMTELEDLVVEDRPVVMEDREDALLPEPLPGEGVAFEGEDLVGTVDHHTFDTEADEAHVAGVGLDAPGEGGGADPFAPDPWVASGYGSETSADPVAHHEVVADPAAALGDHLEAVVDHVHPGIDGAVDPRAEADAFEAALAASAEQGEPAAAEEDDERGSLLRFLSSVKP